jgi:hypothetical protein
VLRRLAGAR